MKAYPIVASRISAGDNDIVFTTLDPAPQLDQCRGEFPFAANSLILVTAALASIGYIFYNNLQPVIYRLDERIDALHQLYL
jgi:hypothetical protein